MEPSPAPSRTIRGPKAVGCLFALILMGGGFFVAGPVGAIIGLLFGIAASMMGGKRG